MLSPLSCKKTRKLQSIVATAFTTTNIISSLVQFVQKLECTRNFNINGVMRKTMFWMFTVTSVAWQQHADQTPASHCVHQTAFTFLSVV